MPKESKIDCIVVGYHDINFQTYATAQKKMSRFSGAYRDVKHNSFLMNGRRITSMDLLNQTLTKTTGRDPKLSVFEVPSLGVTYLTSFLRRRHFNVEMVSFFNFQKEKFAHLLAESPRAVAITTTYYVTHIPILDVVKFVREHSPQTKVIVGGPHIYDVYSNLDLRTQDHIFQTIGADIYVGDSQGEQTLADTLTTLRDGRFEDLGKVPNLIYTSDHQNFERTRREPENNDLDSNRVDWSIFNEEEARELFSFPVFLRTARSCPFSCSFCNFPAVAGAHSVTELEALESDFRYLHERGVKDLIFIDDTFNVPLPRFKNLLRMMIRNKFDFNWISFFRCSNADDVAFDLMHESGCQQVFLGIESGDQQILNNMNKFADVNKYKEGIRKLNERGIVTYASIISGFPGETKETFMNTLRFIEESRPTFFNIQLYYHDLRTPIAKEADTYQIHGAGYSWKHATMTWQEAADWADYGFKTIKNSVPTTLYGFSIWALPYLLAKNISLDQIKDFAAISREMLVQSFDDTPVRFNTHEQRLVSLFQNPS